MDLLKKYETDYPYKEETYKIIGCAMEVHSELGSGFLEAVYQEALSIVFNEKQIPFEQEKILNILFKERFLKKQYSTDFYCYNKIIVELKAVNNLANNDLSQVLNYLKATNQEIGLLINFGAERLEYKRVIRTINK